ncbi:unnamed protein product [Camellia sinensis]
MIVLVLVHHHHLANGIQESWVKDISNPPQYSATTCPFIEKEFNCQNNGRPDHNYLYYSWHPTSCDLPRSMLDGRALLSAGDSLVVVDFYSPGCRGCKALHPR